MRWTCSSLIMLLLTGACVAPDVKEADTETRELLEQSGAAGVIPYFGVPRDSNIVLGKVDLQYDDTLRPDTGFRMAIMIKLADGNEVEDFFYEDIPISEKSPPVAEGGTIRGEVPSIEFWADGGGPESVSQFVLDFPEHVRKHATLTFKSFQGNVYFLENAPAGRYYIWIQTGFDGNRVFQFPLMMELRPVNGRINRHDIVASDFRKLFHTL